MSVQTRKKVQGETSENAGVRLFLVLTGVSGILLTLFVDPIKFLFDRPTPRFKKLSHLRMDVLCKELMEGGDFEIEPQVKESPASERELQKVAYHISERSALGATEKYPELAGIFQKDLFWVYRNGYTVSQSQSGFRLGFYLAILIGVIGYFTFPL